VARRSRQGAACGSPQAGRMAEVVPGSSVRGGVGDYRRNVSGQCLVIGLGAWCCSAEVLFGCTAFGVSTNRHCVPLAPI
jgi:hypothetical protein